MKIAYIGQMADVSCENSISKKIRDQTRFWQEVGHTVRYFALAASPGIWPALATSLPVALHPRSPVWRRASHSRALCRAVAAWRPDVIYFRYAYHSAGLPALFRSVPAVAELNSDDTREYALTLGPWKTLYHRLTRRRILGAVSGFVSVTRELSELVKPFARPVEVIANSIHLDAPPPTAAIDSLTQQETRLVFAGTPRTPWHGLDRIAELARLFPHWRFDILGDDASTWPLTASSSPPANLRLHGHLSRERYLPLMIAATAALGTFGLYRKGMHEACPLKVREYLAHGLPVIGACADTDIPDDADYYLRLPNDDTPLAPHRDAVAAFVARWRDRRVPRASVAHIDTNVKEARRLAFMRDVLVNWRTQRGLPSPARS